MEHPCLVCGLELYQLQPLSNTRKAGTLGHQGGDAYPDTQGSALDGIVLPPVLIPSGIVGHKIFRPEEAQFGQLFPPCLPHTGKPGERGIQGHGHGDHLLGKW